jgi:hypothetical protein
MSRMIGLLLVLAAGSLVWTVWGTYERVVLSGRFHSVAHKGSGAAEVVALPGGNRVLRLTGVNTYPSPDLQVCLAAAPDAEDNASVLQSGMVCVGSYDVKRPSATYKVPASSISRDTARWCCGTARTG